MHTFFINTSKKRLDEYDVLFDIHYQNMSLIYMDCPISDWYKDNGYLECVRRMGDMIDGYAEINNSFNLILYIDLPENEAYSSIPKDMFSDKKRDECRQAMHILFTHLISESIVAKLNSIGRKPQNVLIMFGEEKRYTDIDVAEDAPQYKEIMKYVFDFMGLPDEGKVTSIAQAIHKREAGAEDEAMAKAFCDEIARVAGPELVPGIRDGYGKDLHFWYDSVMKEKKVPEANKVLFNSIKRIDKAEMNRIGIKRISCPYDHDASEVNKSVWALSRLNIALHLLQCVENNSIYVKGDGPDAELLEFHVYTAEDIAKILKKKEKQFAAKEKEIEGMQTRYSDLKLAPKLREFKHAMFGLDQYGKRDVKLVDVDVPADGKAEHAEPEDASEPDQERSDAVTLKGRTKKGISVVKEGRPLFTKEELAPFGEKFDHSCKKLFKMRTKPTEFTEQAKEVKKHHKDYLEKMQRYVSDVLSNYAGKSKDNKAPLLTVDGYRYGEHEANELVVESAEHVADRAYGTMLDQYMEFCAGRSVALTNIDEQYDWFVSRVHQIEESLRRLKRVAVGLLIAILLLYIPFVVIQFDAIVENVLTLAVALASVAIPMALLYVVFTIMALVQKKQYLKAWEIFLERSDQALEENKIAAQKYYQLLSTIIPGLRWVYEYKLDVDYCAECCSVADAKVEHHRRKLRERIFAIRNMLRDLEYKGTEESTDQRPSTSNHTDKIDYNTSFCTGKDNRAFYMVFGRKDIQSATK